MTMVLILIYALVKKTAVPVTTMSRTPSNTELVSILQHRNRFYTINYLINWKLSAAQKRMLKVWLSLCLTTCLKIHMFLVPESYNSIGSIIGSLLLQLPDQFIPDIWGQLGQSLDLSSNQALESWPDVTEHVPALHLAGHHQPLVLQRHGHAGLVGGVHLHCFNCCLRGHAWLISEMKKHYKIWNNLLLLINTSAVGVSSTTTTQHSLPRSGVSSYNNTTCYLTLQLLSTFCTHFMFAIHSRDCNIILHENDSVEMQKSN